MTICHRHYCSFLPQRKAKGKEDGVVVGILDGKVKKLKSCLGASDISKHRNIRAGHQWLTAVIIATQGVEIRRITKSAQTNSSRDPIPKNLSQTKGWWSDSR
jgi:hypothetical protein